MKRKERQAISLASYDQQGGLIPFTVTSKAATPIPNSLIHLSAKLTSLPTPKAKGILPLLVNLRTAVMACCLFVSPTAGDELGLFASKEVQEIAWVGIASSKYDCLGSLEAERRTLVLAEGG